MCEGRAIVPHGPNIKRGSRKITPRNLRQKPPTHSRWHAPFKRRFAAEKWVIRDDDPPISKLRAAARGATSSTKECPPAPLRPKKMILLSMILTKFRMLPHPRLQDALRSPLHQDSVEVSVLGGFFVLRGRVTVKVDPLRNLL